MLNWVVWVDIVLCAINLINGSWNIGLLLGVLAWQQYRLNKYELKSS